VGSFTYLSHKFHHPTPLSVGFTRLFVCLSVHKVFRTLFRYVRSYYIETLYMALYVWVTDQFRRLLLPTNFRRVTPLKEFYSFPDFFFSLLTDIHLIFGILLCHTKIQIKFKFGSDPLSFQKNKQKKKTPKKQNKQTNKLWSESCLHDIFIDILYHQEYFCWRNTTVHLFGTCHKMAISSSLSLLFMRSWMN
jgi:hypothetical protein